MKQFLIVGLIIGVLTVISVGAEAAGRNRGRAGSGQGSNSSTCPYDGQGPQDGTGQQNGRGR